MDVFWISYGGQVIATAITIVVFLLVKYLSRKLVRKYGHAARKTELRMMQVRQVIAVMTNILFVLAAAVIWGVRAENVVGWLVSVLAVLGVALFAQWSVLSNVTAGVVMFFSAPFRIGDRIRIIDKDAPIVATIENIGTFYTHIRTDDNELIVLPNNLFMQKMVSIYEEEE